MQRISPARAQNEAEGGSEPVFNRLYARAKPGVARSGSRDRDASNEPVQRGGAPRPKAIGRQFNTSQTRMANGTKNIKTLNKENDTIEAKSKPTLAQGTSSATRKGFSVDKFAGHA